MSKIHRKIIPLLSLCLILCIGSVSSSLSERMYEQLDSTYFCFRRLNKTHQIGCSSDFNGNTGVVHIIKEGDDGGKDIDYIIKNGPDNKYIAVIPESGVSKIILKSFESSGRVSGVVIIKTNSSETPTAWSADGSCPNSISSFYNSNDKQCHKWNHPENRMSEAHLQNWPFPIFYFKNVSSIESIRDCHQRFNLPTLKESSSTVRKCALKLFARMSAAKDADTCIRRSSLPSYLTETAKFCDPLSGASVTSLLKQIESNKSADDKSIVLLTARMDTFSMFDEISPGADSAVSGMVTLLAVADALNNALAGVELKKNVMFTLLNGEAFDYIGSSSLIYDILKRKFVYNVSVTSFSHVIELNQLFPNKDSQYFIHVDPDQYKDQSLEKDMQAMINKTIELFSQLGTGISVSINTSQPLPPSSLHSFLNNGFNIPSMVLTNFDDQFTNQFYNSLYDTFDYQIGKDNLDKYADTLRKVATVIAKVVVSLVSDASLDKVKVEAPLADMITCYTKNASCPYFHSIIDERFLPYLTDEPHRLYVSVTPRTTPAAMLSYRGLARYTGQVEPNATTFEECTKMSSDGFDFLWMFGPNYNHSSSDSQGQCYKTVAKVIRSLSPHYQLAEGEKTMPWFSTWTESIWANTEVTLYVQPSNKYQGTVLGCGFAIFIVSLALTFMVHRNAESIFEDHTPVGC